MPCGFSGPASASPGPTFGGFGPHAVFVETDNPAGNQVVSYLREPNGQLVAAGTYNTGGVGGQLAGSVVDHQASEGALSYDPTYGLLFATNAGSDTVSVFAAHGTQLSLLQVVSSGGVFPVSVTESGNSVYVLNALSGGSVQGFSLFFDHLFTLPGSNRSLGLSPTATPQFTNTPGQVTFTPNGSQLIVTTKANGNDIDVFHVGPVGRTLDLSRRSTSKRARCPSGSPSTRTEISWWPRPAPTLSPASASVPPALFCP